MTQVSVTSPTREDKVFTLYPAKLSWFDARKFCLSVGGDLATVSNVQEKGAIEEKLSSKSVWIGLNDIYDEEYHSWVSGDPATYRYWHAGSPNDPNSIKDCVLKSSDGGGWVDENCSVLNNFICEKCQYISGGRCSQVLSIA
jgi:hypothetical protein